MVQKTGQKAKRKKNCQVQEDHSHVRKGVYQGEEGTVGAEGWPAEQKETEEGAMSPKAKDGAGVCLGYGHG